MGERIISTPEAVIVFDAEKQGARDEKFLKRSIFRVNKEGTLMIQGRDSQGRFRPPIRVVDWRRTRFEPFFTAWKLLHPRKTAEPVK